MTASGDDIINCSFCYQQSWHQQKKQPRGNTTTTTTPVLVVVAGKTAVVAAAVVAFCAFLPSATDTAILGATQGATYSHYYPLLLFFFPMIFCDCEQHYYNRIHIKLLLLQLQNLSRQKK